MVATTAQSQSTPGQSVAGIASSLSWTDLADLTLASPIVARVTVVRVSRLNKRDAPDVPLGQVRALVQADVAAAIAAPDLLPARVAWLWQGAGDARGRPTFAKGASLLLFARPVEGRADQLTLTNAAGQQPWSDAAEAIVRDVLAQARAPDRIDRVTGVSDAFHAEGAVAGESESQFFVTSPTRPLTLVLLRRPGVAPALRLATGDLIDDSAAPVRPRTLLWRALACGLPRALPANLATDAALAADWRAALDSLGACGRTL